MVGVEIHQDIVDQKAMCHDDHLEDSRDHLGHEEVRTRVPIDFRQNDRPSQARHSDEGVADNLPHLGDLDDKVEGHLEDSEVEDSSYREALTHRQKEGMMAED